uniref:Uncharacterized protein n=1 Tax=Rhizophora mucronata TaxID=61149 RepID=A0A2P2QFL3_RHIMU
MVLPYAAEVISRLCVLAAYTCD